MMNGSFRSHQDLQKEWPVVASFMFIHCSIQLLIMFLCKFRWYNSRCVNKLYLKFEAEILIKERCSLYMYCTWVFMASV